MPLVSSPVNNVPAQSALAERRKRQQDLQKLAGHCTKLAGSEAQLYRGEKTGRHSFLLKQPALKLDFGANMIENNATSPAPQLGSAFKHKAPFQ